MPRQIIRSSKADPDKSLGWLAIWWIETFVVHGPGDVAGQPIVHGDEYSEFIVNCYALDPANGRRLHDSAFISRPKGCNKSGLAAELCLFEAVGPCRFAGWAKGGETYEFLGHKYTYTKGEPMGKSILNSYVRVLATEEEQTSNTFDMIYNNMDEGPLSELKAYGMKVNLGKIFLHTGGQITISTTGSASKDGGKETFAIFDESHLYINPKLRKMYETVVRNLPKRAKIAETWYLETTTMYASGEESVAEDSYNYAQDINESQRKLKDGEKRRVRVKRDRLLFDHRYGVVKDLSDEAELLAGIEDAYGDALEFNDAEAVMDKIFDPRVDPVDARRYYLNSAQDQKNAWLETVRILKAMEGGLKLKNLIPGEKVTLGFDGAVSKDSTALILCRVSDGALFNLKIEEQPDGKEAVGWTVDQAAFDSRVQWAFKTFTVVGFFADPPYWQEYIDKWELKYGEQLKVKGNGEGNHIRFYTNRITQQGMACDRLFQAINAKEGAIELHNDPVLKRHLQNARKWERGSVTIIGKEGKNSKKKMDGAVAAVLAFEARARYLSKPPPEKLTFVPRRADKKVA